MMMWAVCEIVLCWKCCWQMMRNSSFHGGHRGWTWRLDSFCNNIILGNWLELASTFDEMLFVDLPSPCAR